MLLGRGPVLLNETAAVTETDRDAIRRAGE
jgi:hypothetical protein